jgi:hypothetical protein
MRPAAQPSFETRWTTRPRFIIVSLKKCFWAAAFISVFNTQTMHIKPTVNNCIAMLSHKTLHPGGIRTRVFCSWGGCDVIFAIHTLILITYMASRSWHKKATRSRYSLFRDGRVENVCQQQKSCFVNKKIVVTVAFFQARSLRTIALTSGACDWRSVCRVSRPGPRSRDSNWPPTATSLASSKPHTCWSVYFVKLRFGRKLLGKIFESLQNGYNFQKNLTET